MMKTSNRDALWGFAVICLALSWYLDARQHYGTPAVLGSDKTCPQCGCRDEGHALVCPVITAFIEQRIKEATR